jgi:hypothetical protein
VSNPLTLLKIEEVIMNTKHETHPKAEVLEIKLSKVDLRETGISSVGRYFNKE